jgi:hypothetical protein
MKPEISSSKLQPTQTAAKGITGNKLKTTGTQFITFRAGSNTFNHKFLIAPLDVEYSGILGIHILKRMEAKVDLRTSTLVLGRTNDRLSGQEVEGYAINRQPQAVREVSVMGLIIPEATGPKASVGIPIPGLISGEFDTCCWDLVVSGPVALPQLSQRIFVSKIRGKDNLDVPREVLVEPIGIGTPGAYAARVASRVYTREELDALGDLEERSKRKSGSSINNDDVEAYANDIRRYGKALSLQAIASNSVRFCVLKILNTIRQQLEIWKNVKLGTAVALLQRAPKVTGFDSRNLAAGETSVCRVSFIRGNKSVELVEVQAQSGG